MCKVVQRSSPLHRNNNYFAPAPDFRTVSQAITLVWLTRLLSIPGQPFRYHFRSKSYWVRPITLPPSSTRTHSSCWFVLRSCPGAHFPTLSVWRWASFSGHRKRLKRSRNRRKRKSKRRESSAFFRGLIYWQFLHLSSTGPTVAVFFFWFLIRSGPWKWRRRTCPSTCASLIDIRSHYFKYVFFVLRFLSNCTCIHYFPR